MVINRFEVHLVNLDPTVGREIKKTRPCLVISPDEMNRHIRTVIVAPMTTKGRGYPTRVPCRFKGKSGQIVLDQIWTVDFTSGVCQNVADTWPSRDTDWSGQDISAVGNRY